MGGKRPDQYRLDHDEAGTTDYKFYPNRPEEGDREAQLYGRVMKGRVRAEQPIPSSAPEPEAGREREEEDVRQAHIHEQEERLREGDAEPPQDREAA